MQRRAWLALTLLALPVVQPHAGALPPPTEMVIVGFRGGSIPADANATLADHDATLVRADENLDYILVASPDPSAYIQDVRGRADVEFAYRNQVGSVAVDRDFCVLSGLGSQACTVSCSTPLVTPRAPHDAWYWGACGQTPTNWGQAMVGAETAWTRTTGSPLVIVAVVDTGVDPAHPDLAESLVRVGDVFGINEFVAHGDASPPYDETGHGTFVAGVLAARRDNGGMVGMAQTAILAVKACNPLCYEDTVASGIADATVAGASVITLSVSTPPPPYDNLMRRAVQFADARGVLLVAAAGNCQCDRAGTPHDVIYPAKYPEVLAVGAVLPNGTVAAYSRWGPELDLVAPGGGVNEARLLSTLPGGTYGLGSGTSFAVPFVAGTAALLKAQHPAWTAADVRARLEATAIPLDADGRAGHGLVDAGAATGS